MYFSLRRYAKRTGNEVKFGPLYKVHECKNCGGEIVGKFRSFCSPECRAEAWNKAGATKPTSKFHVVNLKCDGCGKKFQRTKQRIYISKRMGTKREFCSIDCYRQKGLFGRNLNREAARRTKVQGSV